jgi:hypothetical protein
MNRVCTVACFLSLVIRAMMCFTLVHCIPVEMSRGAGTVEGGLVVCNCNPQRWSPCCWGGLMVEDMWVFVEWLITFSIAVLCCNREWGFTAGCIVNEMMVLICFRIQLTSGNHEERQVRHGLPCIMSYQMTMEIHICRCVVASVMSER